MTFDVKDAAGYVHDRLVAGKLDPEDVARFVAFYQDKNGLLVDGKPGPATIAHLEQRDADVTVPAGVYIPPGLVDMRAKASREKVYGRRTWEKTTGITYHQTACRMGERPERYLNTGAHVVITKSGKIIWLHDFDDLVIHGHGWNAQCVGFEIDGLFAGVEGDPKTVWNDPSTPHRETADVLGAAQLDAVKHATRWVCHEVVSKGGKVKALVAHRQSTDDRRSDPGEAIWKGAALPMMAELGLGDGGPGFVLGDGMPIPEAWDPSRVGIRY